MASAGRILMLAKGNYDASVTYGMLDIVNHNNASWLCKQPCTGQEPTAGNTDYWQLFGPVLTIATNENAGAVKPDGTTVTVDDDGTIHAELTAEEVGALPTTLTGDAGIIVPHGKNLNIKVEYGEEGSGVYHTVKFYGSGNKAMAEFGDVLTVNMNSGSTETKGTLKNNGNSVATVEIGTFDLTHSTSSVVISGFNYIKIGKVVFVYGNVSNGAVAISAASGDIFSGLPFKVYLGGYITYFWFGTNTSSYPTNNASKLNFGVSNTSITMYQTYSIAQGQPVHLFGIYITE